MHNLSYEVGASIYDDFVQFDKKAESFGKQLKKIAKFFLVLCLYLLFIVIAFLFNVRKSMSIETYRAIMEGVRGLASQDLFVYLILFYQSKVNYILISIAFVCSVSFLAQVFCASFSTRNCRIIARSRRNVAVHYDYDAPVFSYKLNVAFLA